MCIMKTDPEIIREASPLGTLQLEFRNGALIACRLVAIPPATPENPPSEEARKALRELEEYFAGTRRNFSVRLEAAGTQFQRVVWAALRRIPYGEVRTYGEVAAMIGKPTAVRAVGGACHANPCLIFTPCHRIVAAHGTGGFGSGLAAKRLLLGIETGESSPFGFDW
jgi:methylated-DNA-[protein]-cysteine S-methyltransferase